jgi:glucokinase
LGKAISYAVNLINPEKVILGGGVSIDLDLFLPKLEETLRDLMFSEANTGLRIEQTAFLHNAGLIGAAAIAQR